jgi:hypothetical protein
MPIERENQVITKVTLRKRRNDCGEYVVRAYTADGRLYPAGYYFTDNWDDAVETARAMNNVINAERGLHDFSI